jgi:ribonuclease-3
LAVLAEKLEIRKYLLARDAVHSESEKQRDLLDKNPQPSDSATEEQSATSLDADAHMYANHLEAILGAVYLDGGLSATQQLIAQLFFPEEELQKVWLDYPPHPLQSDHPAGDRHMIPHSPTLQKLVHLEESTGVEFRHIRLLAKAFTHSSMQYSHLVRGNYEKLEHLGDAILQFLVSDYLYHKFPTFHEGQFSVSLSYFSV